MSRTWSGRARRTREGVGVAAGPWSARLGRTALAFVAVAVVIGSSAVFAADESGPDLSRPLSLAQLEELALSRNLSIAQALSSEQISRGARLGAWSALLPSLRASLQFNQTSYNYSAGRVDPNTGRDLLEEGTDDEYGLSLNGGMSLVDLPSWYAARSAGKSLAAAGAGAEDARSQILLQTRTQYYALARSEELARPPAHDARFLAGLRQKLAVEPVPLAPAAPVLTARRRQSWLMPVAAAAGFVAVAGVLVVTRLGAPGAPAPAAVMAGDSGAGLTVVNTAAQPAAQAQREAGFIRDPLLDEYLRAHQAARGGVAAASPGGTLRRVDVAAPAGGQR